MEEEILFASSRSTKPARVTISINVTLSSMESRVNVPFHCVNLYVPHFFERDFPFEVRKVFTLEFPRDANCVPASE